MVKLVYSDPALKELKKIHNYIAADSTLYAKKFIVQIRTKISVLKSYPEIAKPILTDRFENLRQLLFKNYRIVYHFHNDVITIITVHHQSRILENVDAIKNYKP